MPATVKANWKMPPAPACKSCGQPSQPVAYHDVDAWYLYWYCDGASCFFDSDMIDVWPFQEDFARASDFESLGFVVE